MKKIISGLFLATTTLFYAQESFTGRDDQRAYVGVNFQDGGTGISAGADYGLGESISVGVQASFS